MEFVYTMLLLELNKIFTQAKFDFVVIGGYAVALHGVTRGTIAIDIAVALNEASFVEAERLLSQMGLVSRLPLRSQEVFQFRKEYAEKRNLIAWSFVDLTNPMRQVDILILLDARKIKKVFKSINGQRVPIASIQDLIRLKGAAGRPQDREDVLALKEILK